MENLVVGVCDDDGGPIVSVLPLKCETSEVTLEFFCHVLLALQMR
jgi:hypothetical protein